MKRKMFAALALSATLAMGAVPAFAADPAASTTDPAQIESGNTQTTTVSVQTKVGQISAKIPVAVGIVADMNGGGIMAPKPEDGVLQSGYRIENHSIFAIQVTAATATADTAKWYLKSDTMADGAEPTPDTSASAGDVYLTLKPGNGTAWVLGKDFSTVSATADEWTVDPATVSGGSTTPGVLQLGLDGKTSKLKESFETAQKVVDIKYTIGVKSTAAETPGA